MLPVTQHSTEICYSATASILRGLNYFCLTDDHVITDVTNVFTYYNHVDYIIFVFDLLSLSEHALSKAGEHSTCNSRGNLLMNFIRSNAGRSVCVCVYFLN